MLSESEPLGSDSFRSDSDILVGSRVNVLPGRQFPSFAAGDAGTVVRVDQEARTCDVLFDRHRSEGPLPVALRHLATFASGLGSEAQPLRPSLSEMAADGHQRAGRLTPSLERRRPPSELGRRLDDTMLDVEDSELDPLAELKDRVSILQRAISRIDARVAACEASRTAPNLGGGGALLAGRQQSAALEEVARLQSGEVAALRQSLEELRREQEQHQRRQEASARGLEQALWVGEEQSGSLREQARQLECQVESLGGVLDAQVQRLKSLESSVEAQQSRARNVELSIDAAGTGLARLGDLLECHEQRAAELRDTVTSSMAQAFQDHSAALRSELQERSPSRSAEQRREQLGSSMGSSRKEPVWQALRELQELVVHEAEHRAAGLREVLSVLGQGVEQLRTEQARQNSELESRGRSEGRRARKRFAESSARQAEQERRTEALELRLDALAQALSAERCARAEAVAWAAEQPRSKNPAIPDADAQAAEVDSNVPGASEVTSRVLVSQSLQRLEALEAGMEAHGRTPRGEAEESRQTATEGTIGKLRGQLEGLRCELARSAAAVPEEVDSAFAMETAPIMYEKGTAYSYSCISAGPCDVGDADFQSGQPTNAAGLRSSPGGQLTAPTTPIRPQVVYKSPTYMQPTHLSQVPSSCIPGHVGAAATIPQFVVHHPHQENGYSSNLGTSCIMPTSYTTLGTNSELMSGAATATVACGIAPSAQGSVMEQEPIAATEPLRTTTIRASSPSVDMNFIHMHDAARTPIAARILRSPRTPVSADVLSTDAGPPVPRAAVTTGPAKITKLVDAHSERVESRPSDLLIRSGDLASQPAGQQAAAALQPNISGQA